MCFDQLLNSEYPKLIRFWRIFLDLIFWCYCDTFNENLVPKKPNTKYLWGLDKLHLPQGFGSSTWELKIEKSQKTLQFNGTDRYFCFEPSVISAYVFDLFISKGFPHVEQLSKMTCVQHFQPHLYLVKVIVFIHNVNWSHWLADDCCEREAKSSQN